MQTFQVTSPNVCGLIISDNGNSATYLGGTSFKCFAPDNFTFEQFTTTAAAGTRAVAVQSDFNLAKIFGTVALPEVNVSDREQVVFEGTSLTLNAEHSLSGGTLTYQWKKVSSAYLEAAYGDDEIPDQVTRGITIPGATNSSLTVSSPVPTMSGFYCCVVTGTAADNKVGRAFPLFNVTVHDAL